MALGEIILKTRQNNDSYPLNILWTGSVILVYELSWKMSFQKTLVNEFNMPDGTQIVSITDLCLSTSCAHSVST